MFFADENTIARMESDIIGNDPDSKRYSSFEEFMNEMENEDSQQDSTRKHTNNIF